MEDHAAAGPDYYSFFGFQSAETPASRELPSVPDLPASAIFCDFDGTLVDIADRPDAIDVTDAVRKRIARLHELTDGAFCLVSGRRIADLDAFLPDFPGVVIGSHGAERRIDGRTLTLEASDAFQAARDALIAWAEHRDGLLVEEKPASIALHFRAAPDLQGEVAKIAGVLAETTPGYHLHHSKMAVELQPDLATKAAAVADLLDRFTGRRPIAIGDDRTDEGMFAVVEDAGGYGIKVGDGPTRASCRIASTAEVARMFDCWIEGPSGAPCQVD